MPIPELTSQDKRDDKLQLPPPDRAIRRLAERFGLTIPIAIAIANLAFGERDVEARR
jgi:hypothetical protein